MSGTSMGFLKGKMGLRGPTKPGDMISKMNAMKTKKLTMSQWEESSMDKALDKKLGYKEGSKQDKAADKKALAAYNKRSSIKNTIKKII